MNLIVAVDKNWAIGLGGDQLCYIPADLKRFKALTTGHSVLLGRKTMATFPGGKPLKNRRNLVLSTDPEFRPEGAEVFRTIEEALSAAPEDTFVIGGESVYNQLLPEADTCHVTFFDRAFDADTWFPNLDENPEWELAWESEEEVYFDTPYTFRTYRRKTD